MKNFIKLVWDNIGVASAIAIGFGILSFIYQPLPFIIGFISFIAFLIKKAKER